MVLPRDLAGRAARGALPALDGDLELRDGGLAVVHRDPAAHERVAACVPVPGRVVERQLDLRGRQHAQRLQQRDLLAGEHRTWRTDLTHGGRRSLAAGGVDARGRRVQGPSRDGRDDGEHASDLLGAAHGDRAGAAVVGDVGRIAWDQHAHDLRGVGDLRQHGRREQRDLLARAGGHVVMLLPRPTTSIGGDTVWQDIGGSSRTPGVAAWDEVKAADVTIAGDAYVTSATAPTVWMP